MQPTFDHFPSNILETQGRIKKESFIFKYDYVEVWQGGQCIFKNNTIGVILAKVENDRMKVEIDNPEINNYIKKIFHFEEISTNLDRILWSKDILDSKGITPEFSNPDISSLFFINQNLAKVTFTIHDPNTLIEFYSINPQEVNQTNNREKSKDFSHIKNLLAIAAADGNVDDDEKKLIFNIAARAGLTPEELKSIFLNPDRIDLVLPIDENEKFNQLKELVYVMISDGEINPMENSLCNFFASKLGYNSNTIEDIIQSVLQDVSNNISSNTNIQKTKSNKVHLSNIKFSSSDHKRYQTGKHVSGPNGGAPRCIRIEDNITKNEGYTVTIYIMDGDQSVWGNNIQMAPKQMKVISETNEKIVLRGFGFDDFGNSFSDYGLSIIIENGEIDLIILHLHDRNVQIAYLK